MSRRSHSDNFMAYLALMRRIDNRRSSRYAAGLSALFAPDDKESSVKSSNGMKRRHCCDGIDRCPTRDGAVQSTANNAWEADVGNLMCSGF
jgi:hypothetical protein